MRTSETVAKLAEALSAAQGELEHAKKDKKNDHFKSSYADLASICEVLRPVFPKHGLSVVQVPSLGEHGVVLTTRLMHASGEWIEGDLPLSVKGDGMQAVVSAITYARRASLAAITGVAPDDDDGEAAEGRGRASSDKPKAQQKPREQAKPQPVPTQDARPPEAVVFITEAQRQRLYAIASSSGWKDTEVKVLLQKYGYKSSKDIAREDYDAIVRDLEAGAEVPA